MSQENNIIKNRKGKHLVYEERVKIEALTKAGLGTRKIAKILGNRSSRTIRRELQRGLVILLNSDLTKRKEYSAEASQQRHERRCENKGPALKIGNDHKLAKYFEEAIGEKNKSPYAAIQDIANKGREFKIKLSVKTIYNYLDKNLFLNISNKNLLIKSQKKKRSYKKLRRSIRNPMGKCISERANEIEKREEYGHWEMDTVEGKKGTKTSLLVLSERMTRQEIIFKIKNKSQKCVIQEIDKLEKKLGGKFKNIFKTITCDNGSENLDFERIEKSVLREGKRTSVYYAHPYSAYERGTNENINKMIRRFIPKGSDISKYSKKQIMRIEMWINNYPRKILNGISAKMAVERALA